jgi:hypothetical protein
MKKLLLTVLLPLLCGCMIVRSAVRPEALNVNPADLQAALIPSASNDVQKLSFLSAFENQTLLATRGLNPDRTIYFSPDGFAYQLDASGYTRIIAWTLESRPSDRFGYELCMAGDSQGSLVWVGNMTKRHQRKGQKVTCISKSVILGFSPLVGDRYGLRARYKEENGRSS